MELRHLRYFVTVAAELHYARAAQRLVISQPALSQQIRSLEGELGFKLLERNSRGVQLTPEGEAFLREAKIVVRDADHAVAVARALAEGATGYLRLSHLRTMPRGLPERIVSEYQQRYPGSRSSRSLAARNRTSSGCVLASSTSRSCWRPSRTPQNWAASRSRPNPSWSRYRVHIR